jgi:alpha-glucosidase
MRWDASPGGGFSAADPWLPAAQPLGIDVASQVGDPNSTLSLYRALLRLRRAERALNVGEWHDLGAAGTSLAYMRSDAERRFLVALNLAGQPSPVPKAARGLRGTVVISTLPDGPGVRFLERRELAADEGLLILLD